MSYETPFAGLKVIDLSQGVAGPYCGMLLAQYGADVIKVEPPEGGDWARNLGVTYGDQCAYSIPANLGKRSIALDLKSDTGKNVLWRMVAGADVFIQGFRPGVIDRLGFGYEAVRAKEPRAIYVSVSGFGQRGPLAERPAMDPVLQAYTGLTSENRGEDGIPHRVPVIVIDMTTAIYAFGAVSTALYARRGMDHGRHIEVSLMGSAAGLQVVRMMQASLEGGEIRPLAPPSGVYRTADGFISITVVKPFEWAGFCAALGQEGLARDDALGTHPGRLAQAERLWPLFRGIVASKTTAAWSALLTQQRIMHEAINTYLDFLNQPHVKETGVVSFVAHAPVPQPVPLPNIAGLPPFVSGTPRATAPGLGEHGRAILAEHGYSAAEIADLGARGVVALRG